MSISKAESRREKMRYFDAQLDAEKSRLAALDLPLPGLIYLFGCGNVFTEPAAAHCVQVRHARSSEVVIAAMLAGLSHSHWKVRRTCADFMDHWGDQCCVEPLLRALDDPKENVRRLALHSLSCQQCKVTPLQGDFVPALIKVATTDRSLRTRRIATNVLGNYLPDVRVMETLQYLTANDPDATVAMRAHAALSKIHNVIATA